jgi:SAM-dependent methyltransferase
MHLSVLAFLERAITEQDVAGQHVIEAGSLNVNGSPREHVMSLGPASYTGIDVQAGDGVDVVMDAADLPGPLELAGLVVSTSMLEHAQDWQAALRGVIEAVAPGGCLVLTAPSAGFPYHHPPDHWRFSLEATGAIVKAAALEVLILEADPGDPGVVLKARKRVGWVWPRGAFTLWDRAGVTPVTL